MMAEGGGRQVIKRKQHFEESSCAFRRLKIFIASYRRTLVTVCASHLLLNAVRSCIPPGMMVAQRAPSNMHASVKEGSDMLAILRIAMYFSAFKLQLRYSLEVRR